MRRASTSLLEKGIQNAIPFSRPHPRSKPQTVAEELTWKLEHRTGARHGGPVPKYVTRQDCTFTRVGQ